MKSGSLGTKTPPPERKSKFAALGKLFKPWKWKRRKKSEKIEKTAVDLERKISLRVTREELIRKGVLKEVDTDGQDVSVDGLDSVTEGDDLKEERVVENGELWGDRAGPDTNSSGSIYVTTTADITPVDTKVMLSAAQIRPVVVPIEVQIPQVPEPNEASVPPIPQPEPELPPPPEYSPVTPAHPNGYTLLNSSISLQINAIQPTSEVQAKVNNPGSGEPDGEEDYDNLNTPLNPPSPYEAIPACEPDLSMQPKKSALKQKGMNGRPSTPVVPIGMALTPVQLSSAGEQTTPSSRLLNSPAVPVIPLPSPQATPTTRSNTKQRYRVRINENKENIPDREPEPPPRSDTNTDYDNLPGDDSSSDDEEVLYRDDIEITSTLAAKVARQDSLARFLSNRPSHRELVEKNIIPVKSEAEKIEDRHAIGTKLTRRLSLRPSPEELEQRNILHNQSQEEQKKLLEEKKRFLVRKLSFRPSVEELKEKKIIKFSDYVEVTEAHEYDRRADKPWTRLTPRDKAAIRKELNEFKSKEMEVHEDSKHLTRFHRP
ncbi:phosphatase and actin regulator 4-like isoform X2 [Liolophura sinensis]